MSTKHLLPGLGELISESFTIASKKSLLSLGILLAAISPICIVLALVLLVPQSSFDTTISLVFAVISIIGLLAFIILMTRAIIEFIHLYYGDSTKATVANVFDVKNLHWFQFLWRHIAIKLMISGGTMLLIVPGIILGLEFTFALPEYILSGSSKKSLQDILSRSRGMTEGVKWGLFGRYILLGLVAFIPAIIFSILFVVVSNAVTAIFVVLAILFGIFVVMAGSGILYKKLQTMRPSAHLPVRTWFIAVFIVLGIISSFISVNDNKPAYMNSNTDAIFDDNIEFRNDA